MRLATSLYHWYCWRANEAKNVSMGLDIKGMCASWPFWRSRSHSYWQNLRKIFGAIFVFYTNKIGTQPNLQLRCAGTTSMKFPRSDKRVSTALAGTGRIIFLYCRDAETVSSIPACRTISDGGCVSHSCAGVSLKKLSAVRFFPCLFSICKVYDSLPCTGEVLALCAVQGWSLKSPLGTILVVKVQMAERIPGRVLPEELSDDPTLLESPSKTLLWIVILWRFITFIIFFKQNSRTWTDLGA